MMRRRPALALAATAVAALSAVSVASAAAPAKAPTFRRTVLDPQGSYGEPSLAITNDGKHIAVCVPGGDGTYVWYSGNDGRSFGKSATHSGNGGGDCELDYLPDGTLMGADLEVYDSNVKLSKD